MKNSFTGSEQLAAQLLQASQQLMATCPGWLLPFDTYCISAALRGLDTVRAYDALVGIDNFHGCNILARTHLDSLIRVNGVMQQPDPHSLAQRLIEGEKLRNIAGADGKRLTDGHLVGQLAKNNPWITPAYALMNESVHLSSLHYKTMLAQGLHQRNGIVTIQYLGDSSYVQAKDKAGLNLMFSKITHGIGTALEYWALHRGSNPSTKSWFEKAQKAGAV